MTTARPRVDCSGGQRCIARSAPCPKNKRAIGTENEGRFHQTQGKRGIKLGRESRDGESVHPGACECICTCRVRLDLIRATSRVEGSRLQIGERPVCPYVVQQNDRCILLLAAAFLNAARRQRAQLQSFLKRCLQVRICFSFSLSWVILQRHDQDPEIMHGRRKKKKALRDRHECVCCRGRQCTPMMSMQPNLRSLFLPQTFS